LNSPAQQREDAKLICDVDSFLTGGDRSLGCASLGEHEGEAPHHVSEAEL
jgi:hypothetical protein